jgi:hypothetical protein
MCIKEFHNMAYSPEDNSHIGTREQDILRELLHHEGITHYVIVFAENEGRGLSDSPEDAHAWEVSGYIVTPDTVHNFWLGWDAEHQCYTLGRFFDFVYDVERIKSLSNGPKIFEAQEYLRQHP